MNLTKHCPFCDQPISEAQYEQVRERIRKAEDPAIVQELGLLRQEIAEEVKKNLENEYAPLRKQVDAYAKKEKELSERSTQLALRERAVDAEVARKLSEKEKELVAAGEGRAKQQFEATNRQKDTEIKRLDAQVKKLSQEMEGRIASEVEGREQNLRDQVQREEEAKYSVLRQKLQEYQRRDLEFEKEKQALALKEQAIDLAIQKRLSTERDALVRQAAQQARETYEMEVKEKDRNIQLLRQQVNQLHERLQSGSAQTRGYIQQEDLARFLTELYPDDEVAEIKRGVYGADILHTIRLRSGSSAGTILWESKRTKDFHANWIDKLREDQREQKADMAILVSQVLPEDINQFAVVGGVIVTHPSVVDSLSGIVRQHLINLTRQRFTAEQRQDKVHELYSYMTGKEFHQRISGIVEAVVNLDQLAGREIRSHQRLWAQRRKLHEGVVKQAALLYGEIAGIVGTLPAVPQLELPPGTNELEEATEEPAREDEDIPF